MTPKVDFGFPSVSLRRAPQKGTLKNSQAQTQTRTQTLTLLTADRGAADGRVQGHIRRLDAQAQHHRQQLQGLPHSDPKRGDLRIKTPQKRAHTHTHPTCLKLQSEKAKATEKPRAKPKDTFWLTKVQFGSNSGAKDRRRSRGLLATVRDTP